MAKREIKNRHTEMNGDMAVQLEQTVTYNDSMLPTPAEMEAYKNVDPSLLKLIVDSTRLEQRHRHDMDSQKLKILRRSESRIERINFWGMFFAFLALVLMIAVCAYALYLDKPWFAGVMGGTVIVSVISLFVNAGNKNK